MHEEKAGATGNIRQGNITKLLNEVAENSDRAQGQSNILSPYSLHSSEIKLPHVLLSLLIIYIVDYIEHQQILTIEQKQQLNQNITISSIKCDF